MLAAVVVEGVILAAVLLSIELIRCESLTWGGGCVCVGEAPGNAPGLREACEGRARAACG